jgi:protein-disulfide isomerase
LTPPSSRRALLVSAISAAVVGAAAPAAKPPAKTSGRPPAPVRKSRWPTQPGDMSLGNPNAPVWVVEYLSLTCPHCAHFNAEVFPALKAKYVDKGRVYYTIRELLTAPAQVAAAGFLMARCGGGSKYFPIVDQVFRSQARWQPGVQIAPIFLEIAKANGLTEEQFNACITDEKASAALEARLQYATETDHVTGTPTFFINGKLLENDGVPTLPEMDAAIAKALQPAPRAQAGRK